MEYYLIEISKGDKKIAGVSIYTYTERNDAIAAYHTKLGQAMKSELFEREQLLVINSANGIEAGETDGVFEREIAPVVEEEVVAEE